MTVGFAVWLPADLWFFLAQRQNRVAQFAPFDAASGVARLARYLAANLLGGLPLYVGGVAGIAVAAALAALLVALAGLMIRQWRSIAAPGPRLLLAMAAAAPPVGLLLLGLAFNNTPIELRYLAFATPFVGLLLAGTFASLPRTRGPDRLLPGSGSPNSLTHRTDHPAGNDAASTRNGSQRIVTGWRRRRAAAAGQ